MKQGYTDITVILDKSGSMHPIAKDTVGSYNTFVEEQAKLDGKCTITLVQFASSIENTYTLCNAKELKPLVLKESYNPDGGSTALLDAIGKTIESVGAKYAQLSEDERPEKVVIVILTDGQENSSREFSRSAIFDLITHQKDKYNWQFIFLGANQDAISTGSSLGIGAGDSLSYGYTERGITLATHSLSSKVSAYRSCSLNAMPEFTEQDRSVQKDEGAL